MKSRLLTLWEQLNSNFWFVPSLMVVGAALLASLTIGLDRALDRSWESLVAWTYTGGPEGARALLSAIAGTAMGVAGTIFSITIAALTLASSQFGPRLLGNFVRDRGNQLVLGTFIATFLYCLLVLRTVRTAAEEYGEAAFVPQISITVAVLLAVACVGVLIYFINHVARDIQAEHIVVSVSRDLRQTIARLYPDVRGDGPDGDPQPGAELLAIIRDDGQGLPAPRSGYVQAIDAGTLMRIASERDLTVLTLVRPGAFVIGGSRLAVLYPAQSAGDGAAALRDAFVIGDHRTTLQDAAFGFEQLVEIAVRALSPGVNDPFTALSCLNHLGAALCELARRAPPAAYLYGDGGALRVIARPLAFADAAEIAFGQIRHYARASAPVLLRMLEVIAAAAECARTDEQREALALHARLIAATGRDSLADAHDRDVVAASFEAVVQALR